MIKIWKTNDHFFFKKFWKKKKNILKKNLIIDHFNWSLVFQKFYYEHLTYQGVLWTFGHSVKIGLSRGFVLFSHFFEYFSSQLSTRNGFRSHVLCIILKKSNTKLQFLRGNARFQVCTKNTYSTSSFGHTICFFVLQSVSFASTFLSF